MSEKRILYNAIKTPDGTLLHSKYIHDYQEYKDKNGYVYMTDGGNEYLRRNIVPEAPYTDSTIYDDGNHETRRNFVCWGRNYDKNNNLLEKTEYICIRDMDTDHIKAVLKNIKRLSEFYKEVFETELKYRE